MATTTQLLYPAETTSGVVTSFIPLTTVFTHSSACSRYLRLNGDTLVAFDPGYGLDIDSNARCVPSAVTTWWEQGRFGNTNDEDHTAVSLGPMVCPHAWSTVVSSVRDHSSTLAMCCPPGYTLGTINQINSIWTCSNKKMVQATVCVDLLSVIASPI